MTSTKFRSFIYTSSTIKFIRFLGFLAILLMVFIPKIVTLFGSIYILNLLNSVQAITIYSCIAFIGGMVNIFYCKFLLYLYLYNWRILIRNSRPNWVMCLIYAGRTCAVVGTGAMTGLVVPGLDYAFERRGLVPPLKSFYGSGKFITGGYITPEIGCEPSKNLYVLKGNEFPGASIVRDAQNRSLQMETELNIEYLNQELKNKKK